MTLLLYATIWCALALLVAAEAGRWRHRGESGPAAWARPASILGALLITCHVLLAFALRYAWDHEAAVRETARQAAAVYGFEWRGNIYVSHAFVLLWYVEILLWRRGPPGPWTWIQRVFLFTIILNGAVVFATTPWTRALGASLAAALLWAWWPGRRRGALAGTPAGG